MNIQKKRFFVYFLIIVFGFGASYLFLKNDPTSKRDVSAEELSKKDSIVDISLFYEEFDFESNNEAFVSSVKSRSGKNCCAFSNSIEFGVSVIKPLKDFPNYKNIKRVTVIFNVQFEKEDPDALYVLSIDDNKGKSLFWDGKPILYDSSGTWSEGIINFIIPAEFLNPENKITVYAWNRNKKVFYMDDVSVNFIGTNIYQKSLTTELEKSNIFIDFETEATFSSAEYVKETFAHSGKRASDLSGGIEFGFSFKKKLSELGAVVPTKINLSMWVYPLAGKPKTVLTASVVDAKNVTVFWDGEGTDDLDVPLNKWTKINAAFLLPREKFRPDDVLNVAVWNKGKTDVIVDDIEIVYGESPERRGEVSKIDPISIYEKRFVPAKNKPPFKTIFFEKQEMGSELESFTPNDIFLVGNFNADEGEAEELLCISKNKQALFTFNPSKNAFQKIWENNNLNDLLWNKENIYDAKIINGKYSLVVQQKNKPVGTSLSFDGKSWQKTGEQKTIPTQASSNSINLFSGNFTSDKNQILKLDRTWRFDLKLLEGDNILGMVDFKGYSNDYNPKYYEFVKLVPGNFLSKNQTSLLVVMCNCGDANFSGEKCNQLESLPFLPNKVELYSIQKEKNGTQIKNK